MQASTRFCSSSAFSKKVFADISDAVARSSYRPLCGKTHAASPSSHDPPKVQKRVSKQERRARVEEFVQNYRASHEGKFPSATSVRQRVGGSFYISWELHQELEYNSRLKSDARDASFNSRNFEGRYGLKNIGLSTKDARTKEEVVVSKVRKRVTKQERRIRVEEFVENYRASHGGKFPRATHVRQHVGGSYYIALALLQELVYNSRLENDVRNVSFNSESVTGKYGFKFNNNDISARQAILSFEGMRKKRRKHAHEESSGTNLWGSLKSFVDELRLSLLDATMYRIHIVLLFFSWTWNTNVKFSVRTIPSTLMLQIILPSVPSYKPNYKPL